MLEKEELQRQEAKEAERLRLEQENAERLLLAKKAAEEQAKTREKDLIQKLQASEFEVLTT